jgi:hypothetical protein
MRTVVEDIIENDINNVDETFIIADISGIR